MFTIGKRTTWTMAASWGLVLGWTISLVPAQQRVTPAPGINPAPSTSGFRGGFNGVGAGAVARNPTATLVTAPLNPYGPSTSSASLIANPYDPFNYYSNPYSNPYYPTTTESPFRGYLSGAADVINSQGRFMVSQQQAQLLKQQVRREKLENRRRIFDEWLYERANTPTMEDERARSRLQELRRSQNDPPITEIHSAKALNDLLLDLQKLQAKNVQGPQVALDEDVLKRINVTSLQVGGGNIGLLKNRGRLNWPLALRDLPPVEETSELRRQLETLVPEAMSQAAGGRTDANVLREMDRAVDRLRDRLTKNVGDMPFAQYSEAKRFLSQLEDGLKVLKHEDAANYLNGRYTAQGKTVQELVKHMTEKGLQFASAVAGEEAAYLSLHRAMAHYDTAVNMLVASEQR